MKNTPFHIDENELDLLLRQITLDERADEFTRNSLEMNAEIIFSREGTRSVSLTAAKEKEMIAKLEEAFLRKKGLGRFWLNGIILVVVLSIAGWIYKTNSGTSTSSPSPKSPSEHLIPVSKNDSSEKTTNPAPDKIVYAANYTASQKDSVIPGEDTSTHITATIKKEHLITANSHIPIEKNWYAGEYVVNNIPGPVFSAKPSPENFKAAKDTFAVFGHFPGTMFSTMPRTVPVSFYSGEPFKNGFSDMLYFNLGDYYSISKKYTEHAANSWSLPWQIMEYASPDSVVLKTDTVRGHTIPHLALEQLPGKALQIATEPFYFRKYEVTNKEYREFVNWVRAANGYADKPIYSVVIDTVEVKEPLDHSSDIFTINGKRFRRVNRITPTEDYKEVFNYVFFNTNSPAVKSLGKNSVYILNDTACWTNDFVFSYNEPMTNMYSWHPAYDNYPVIGVSWYQAMAFLDWKTHFHQQQLDAAGIPYEIEYTLPSDIEWNIALCAEKTGKDPLYNFWADPTWDWETNLGLYHPSNSDPYARTNYLKNLFTRNEYTPGNFITDGYFHTGPADITLGKYKVDEEKVGTHHVDPLGISWMDGNVSEWMMESYSVNWKPFFDKHLAVLAADTSESTKLARLIEILYDKGNAANGRLVRGANWYDERFSNKPGATRNDAGVSPKRFIDPSEQHSTIGFRYVVHVKRK